MENKILFINACTRHTYYYGLERLGGHWQVIIGYDTMGTDKTNKHTLS